MNIDKWPSTPVKLVTSWGFSIVFFFFALVLIWTNRAINTAVFMTLAGVVFGHDAVSAAQMIGKRATAWEPEPPAPTASEATQPVTSGQPTKEAP